MIKRAVGTVAAVVIGGVATASPVMAAQQQQSGSCGGVTVTISTPTDNGKSGWSVGQVVDGRGSHYIPTAFSLAVTDTASGASFVIPFGVKGGGNGNHQQQTVTCSFPDTDPSDANLTIGDVEQFTGTTFAAPADDPAALAFAVTAVAK